MRLGWYARLTFVAYALFVIVAGVWWYVSQDNQQQQNAEVWLRLCLSRPNADSEACNVEFMDNFDRAASWKYLWQSIGGAALFGLIVPILMAAAYWTVRWILAGRK